MSSLYSSSEFDLFIWSILSYSVIIFFIKIFYYKILTTTNNLILQKNSLFSSFFIFVPFLGEIWFSILSLELSENMKKILHYNHVKYKPGNRIAFAMLCSFVLSFIGLPIFIISAITFMILFWVNLVKNRKTLSLLKVNNKLKFPMS